MMPCMQHNKQEVDLDACQLHFQCNDGSDCAEHAYTFPQTIDKGKKEVL